MAVAVADKRGMKRICMSCGTRFYDMNNRPVVCPNCKTEFTGEVKAKGRKGRAAANEDDSQAVKAKAAQKEEGDIETSDEDGMVVSLEEVEDIEEGDDDELGTLDMDEGEELGDLEDLEKDADDDSDGKEAAEDEEE